MAFLIIDNGNLVLGYAGTLQRLCAELLIVPPQICSCVNEDKRWLVLVITKTEQGRKARVPEMVPKISLNLVPLRVVEVQSSLLNCDTSKCVCQWRSLLYSENVESFPKNSTVFYLTPGIGLTNHSACSLSLPCSAFSFGVILLLGFDKCCSS